MNNNVIVLSNADGVIEAGDQVIPCPKCQTKALMTPYFRSVMINLTKKKEPYEVRCWACTTGNVATPPPNLMTLDYAIQTAQKPYLQFYHTYLNSHPKQPPRPIGKPNPNLFKGL